MHTRYSHTPCCYQFYAVCQANCSGHGTCDYYSKMCKCKPGWMANPFRKVHGKKGLNCDWSVLYFVLILLAPVLLAAILVWFICCCCYRKLVIILRGEVTCCIIRQKRAVSSRRVRYALLPEDSNDSEFVLINPNTVYYTLSYCRVTTSHGEQQ